MANTLKFGNGQWASKEGSVLAYNDENNNFKPLPFDFTRASSATRVNKDGLIEVVGSDEPRIDFSNDANGALLLEPSRTNLLTYSERLDQWGALNSLTSESSVLSLDGLNNSYQYIRNSASTSYIYQGVNLSNQTSYTASFFVKKENADAFIFDVWDVSQGLQCRFEYNFTSNSFSDVQGNSTFSEYYGNGWYRVGVQFTSETGFTGSYYRIYNRGLVGDILYVWGAQLEEGSYATSYIPTSGAAVTRVADVCNNGGNNQVINSTEGVLYFEGSALVDETKQRWISLGSGSSANRVSILFNATSRISCSVRASSSALYDANFNIGSQTNYTKAAIRYKNNDFAFFVNGVKANSQLSGTLSFNSPLSELAFDSADSGSPFYGKTSQIQVFTTALTDQELIALTTI